MDYLCSYMLAAAGLTVLIVWPAHGPSAWARERLLRPALPGRAAAALDCYVCCGFWSGLALAPLWWWFEPRPWVWLGCLMVPAVFWAVLMSPGRRADEDRVRRPEESLP